uniref:Uncharacterized protein n=1 Tax=Leptocylindrus danicus TaxID=163516 RepID=A0A6U2LHZ6_9STRA|mmetsp:Transcript_12656/g.18998  ORF Transcript_12656/g.18998 Transcript_12656/m.18998 type:complete len:186 (+) Transcript_12656:29-586(+)
MFLLALRVVRTAAATFVGKNARSDHFRSKTYRWFRKRIPNVDGNRAGRYAANPTVPEDVQNIEGSIESNRTVDEGSICDMGRGGSRSTVENDETVDGGVDFDEEEGGSLRIGSSTTAASNSIHHIDIITRSDIESIVQIAVNRGTEAVVKETRKVVKECTRCIAKFVEKKIKSTCERMLEVNGEH